MSNVAAAAFSPFLTAAGPTLFGFDSFTELSRPRRPGKNFRHRGIYQVEILPRFRGLALRGADHAQGPGPTSLRLADQARRNSSTSRRSTWAAMAGPTRAAPVGYLDERGLSLGAAHRRVRQVRLLDRHTRGMEGGGKVEVCRPTSSSRRRRPNLKCPTEIGITDRREAELSKLGFLPLCHYKNTDYAVFLAIGEKPKSTIARRPPRRRHSGARVDVMATSRFAHH